MKFESIDSEFGLGRVLFIFLLPVIKMSRRWPMGIMMRKASRC